MKKDNSIEVAGSFLPQNFKELREFVDVIAESDMVPKAHCGKDGKPKKANLMACIVMGHSLNVPPMQAIQNICVINGMPAVWGDLALALVEQHPDFVDVVEERIDNGWRCTSKRKGRKDVVREFTVDDAKRAKLLNKPGPWQDYTDRMLQMRARGFSIRDQFADALKGVRIREEVIDVKAEVIETESAADKLRSALEKPVEELQPERVQEHPTETLDEASEAVMVLESITKQLKDHGYILSDKESKRLGEISTDEEVVRAIDYFEKKLFRAREGEASCNPSSDDGTFVK